MKLQSNKMINLKNKSKFKLLSEVLQTTEKHQSKSENHLSCALLDSPLGELVVVADDKHVYLLNCLDESKLESTIRKCATRNRCLIQEGRTKPMNLLEAELEQYFHGTLKQFQTPTKPFGTEFQECVWELLKQIPWGEQETYASLATKLGNSNAYRAVGNAVGANPLMIIIPCHRVIHTTGGIGGFSCGVNRKKILLALENKKF